MSAATDSPRSQTVPGQPSGNAGAVFALIAGGGTGGHAAPAIAIGQELVARGHAPASIHFVGSARGMERRLVPDAGFSVTLLPGRGIARRVTISNVGAIAGLCIAVLRAMRLVRRLRPQVVISMGGYASVPCALAAIAQRRPVIVVEQNAMPGLANRLVGRFARASAVSFSNTDLPRSVLTGNPVRAAVAGVHRTDATREAARRDLGLPLTATVVAVATGSLGSRRVNEAVVGLVDRWSAHPPAGRPVAVRHVIGERDWELLRGRVSGSGELVYQPVRFEDRMDLLYGAADVLVGRAGGNTVAELAVVGLPAVLVPLPSAPGDHQTGNARHLEAAGAAVIVPDAVCDGERLDAVLRPLIEHPERLEEMGRAARAVGRPGAAAAVADLIEDVCETARGGSGAPGEHRRTSTGRGCS